MSFLIQSPGILRDQLAGRGLSVSLNQADAAVGSRALVPLDLRALAAEAFGLSPLRRYQLPAEDGRTGTDVQYTAGAPASPAGPANMFGLPVFASVAFGAVSGTSERGAFYGLTLLDPIVTVDAPNSIVKTSITGRRGTVKEYIGADDYAVSIRGILATDINAADRLAYPAQQVRQLQQLRELGAAVPVSGFLLDVFGIKNLVVEDLRFEALPGFINLQAYELDCLSDDPIELAI